MNLRFNQYIKENDDKTLSVWILPAFQPNSVAVYVGEFIYTIDETGTKVLHGDSYFLGDSRGFKVDNPREVLINYQDIEKPTLGAVFFAWYYKSYFTKIVIDNSESNGIFDYVGLSYDKRSKPVYPFTMSHQIIGNPIVNTVKGQKYMKGVEK